MSTEEISDDGMNLDESTERLRAYARDLADVESKKPVSDDWLWEWYPSARAAIKRADAELAEQRHTMGEQWAEEHAEAARLRAAKDKMIESFDAMESRRNEAEKENARLRTQLDHATERRRHHWEEVKRLRAELDAMTGRNIEVTDENDSLRNELRAANEAQLRDHQGMQSLRATIERVRAVLDEYWGDPSASFLRAADIVVALDGES